MSPVTPTTMMNAANTSEAVEKQSGLARPQSPTNRLWVVLVVVLIVFLGFYLVGPYFELSGKIEAWASISIAIVFQAMPFLVFGVLISGAISAFIPDSFVRRVIPRNSFVAVPAAAASGVFLPGCECASVPVSQSLIRRGMPPAAALAFLLASPAINPVVLISTAVAFQGNPLMVVARLIASLAAAMLVGWLWITFGTNFKAVNEHEHHHDGPNKWEAFRAAALHDLLNAGGFLVLGAMLTAVIKVTVPASWFETVNQYPIITCLFMAALAVVLSLCSEADAFIAASFTNVSPTAQLVFLVVGPMIDIKLIGMQYGVWGHKFVLRFAPMTFVVAVVSAIIIGGICFGGL